MRRFTRKEQLFIKKIKEHCKEYGIKVELRDVTYLQLDKNSRCTGYFDEENMKLVCAMKRPDSFPILVHEYAHFTQWIEQCKPWVKLGNSLSYLMDWIDGKSVRSIAVSKSSIRRLFSAFKQCWLLIVKYAAGPIFSIKTDPRSSLYLLCQSSNNSRERLFGKSMASIR